MTKQRKDFVGLIEKVKNNAAFLGPSLTHELVAVLMDAGGVCLVTPEPRSRPPRLGTLRRSAVVQWFERPDGSWSYLVEWRPSLVGDCESSTHGLDGLATENDAINAASMHVAVMGGHKKELTDGRKGT